MTKLSDGVTAAFGARFGPRAMTSSRSSSGYPATTYASMSTDTSRTLSMALRNVPDDARAERVRHRQRQLLPDLDRQIELGFVRVHALGRRAPRVPVLPHELQRLRAPLTFEVERARVGRRTPEIEHGETVLDRELQHV